MQGRVRADVVVLVVAVASLPFVVGGCASHGRRAKVSGAAEVSASGNGEVSENAWSEPAQAPASSSPSSPVMSQPAPPTPSPPAESGAGSAPPPSAAPRPGCSLVCNIANRGRVPAADEARFSSALAGSTEALRGCTGGAPPRMTLRFDSQGTLTYFGADVDDTGENASEACIDAASRQKPALTFSGPSTVRCAERCAR